VIADGDVRAIGIFKTRGHPLYRAEILPWRPIFSTREAAMETTLAYFNSNREIQRVTRLRQTASSTRLETGEEES
jgi:hypothetical protein